MQPVPVIVASIGSPFAIAADRSPSETWSTGPVTEATTPSVRAASRASAGNVGDTADRLDSPHLGLDSDERGDLARVAAEHRDVDLAENPARRSRCGTTVAPAPTGSSTTGTPRAFAARPAASIASTQWDESVPMFSTSAPANPTISSTSSGACAITGSAPSASVAFAVSFMTT